MFPWVGTPTDRDRRAYADAEPRPFWLDRPDRPSPADALEGRTAADLAIVGGGLGGLWAAMLAKEDDPSCDVVVLEGGSIAAGATGRSGGFVNSSLTHGIANGLSRCPDEMPLLERLGRENLERIVAAVEEHRIACDLELTGELSVALEPHEEAWLAEDARELARLGHDAVMLDRDAVRAEVDSPLYRAGLWQRSGAGIVDPARLAWGLARAAGEAGVRLHEQSPVTALRDAGRAIELTTPGGAVLARRSLLATGTFRSPLAQVRRRIVPVWDYVLVTEPLAPAQWQAVGWARRQGVGDVANQFHYYRPTADGRILWGGYDAIHHFRNGIEPRLERREATFARLAHHFFQTFPQLEDIGFTHRWGGPIDTCSRFFAFYGLTHGGRVAYAAGHTGLGIGASRFGARVALDLLAGRETEAKRTRLVRSRPVPFPPEPLRWAVIQATRRALAAADRRQGRRGRWLRLLDRLGLGYDS